MELRERVFIERARGHYSICFQTLNEHLTTAGVLLRAPECLPDWCYNSNQESKIEGTPAG